MPRKLKQYSEGQAQTTGEKKVLFTHAWPKGSKNPLYVKGLHGELEAWMLEHPREQVPVTYFVERYTFDEFKVTPAYIHDVAKKIQKHHKLPSRKMGGQRNNLAPKILEILKREYLKASRTRGKKLNLWELTKILATETQGVIGIVLLSKTLKEIEQAERKSVSIKRGGLPGDKSSTIKKLRKEGIVIWPKLKG